MATAPDMMDEDDGTVEPTKLDAETLANAEGDISSMLDNAQLAKIGTDAVRDYELDLADREPWSKKAKAALDNAAQALPTDQTITFPFEGAADIHYPILTIAALQFHARCYPAVVKGDEVVSVKTIGKDREGRKAARAARVRDFLNTTIMYRMTSWEPDTDALMLQLPIVGSAFRKRWWDVDRGRPASCYVPALRLVVPITAKSLEVAPRLTEELPDTYPYQIRKRMRSGFYRDVDLVTTGDNGDTEAPRLLLEQHRLMDLDEDGVDEPYIITVDKESAEVLRIEPAFDAVDLERNEKGELFSIRRRVLYTHFKFLPDPKGGFYGLGFGHLLTQMSVVIDLAINQMMDAGQAAIAGGGFIASGVRMQGAGQSSWLEWRPGEYKVVDAAAGNLRDSMWERTFPQPSPIMFQLLDLMLGAAKDIAAITDVTSGDASNNGQVGTTLALIEQGLQVFTAIYKRIFCAAREEYQGYYADISDYGDARTASDYLKILDDREADFQTDFNNDDMDIRPISDPGSVTRMQKMARAQFLFGLRGAGLDDGEIMRRVLEAADIEDAEKLMPKAAGPDPMAVATLEKTQSETAKNTASAMKAEAEAIATAAEMGLMIGEADAIGSEGAAGVAAGAGIGGGVQGVAGGPGDAVDAGGFPALGGDAAGGMGAPELAPGPSGPAVPV